MIFGLYTFTCALKTFAITKQQTYGNSFQFNLFLQVCNLILLFFYWTKKTIWKHATFAFLYRVMYRRGTYIHIYVDSVGAYNLIIVRTLKEIVSFNLIMLRYCHLDAHRSCQRVLFTFLRLISPRSTDLMSTYDYVHIKHCESVWLYIWSLWMTMNYSISCKMIFVSF